MKIYLPLIHSNQVQVIEPATIDVYPCGMNKLENTTYLLMKNHSEQQRIKLECNAILMKAANERIRLMTKHDDFDHFPYGEGPNATIRKMGYKLPDWYPDDANVTEILAGNYITPEIVINGFYNSPSHKALLLGLNDTFVAQTQFGIRFDRYSGEKYEMICVILTAPPENGKQYGR